MIRTLFSIVLPALLLSFIAALPSRADSLPQDRSAAVIFAYQRVGEEEYPLVDISLDQFAAQVQELKDGGYNVMALPDIVHALRAGKHLPPRTVALTFDGGYRSVLANAAPLLLKNNLPFTIFVATDQADGNLPDNLDWPALKTLSDNRLVTIGLHPSSYANLTRTAPEEARRQINDAKARLRAMLGINTNLFAYPFGQYSKAYRAIVASSGFDAAFGQQGGVAYEGADLFTLPRFIMTESYGDLDRFRQTATALPFPVTDVTPADPSLATARPNIGFTADPGLSASLNNLVCFISGQGKPDVQMLGRDRVELRLQQDLTEDPTLISCMLPGPPLNSATGDDEPRWRWLGLSLSPPPGAVPPDNDGQDMDTDGGDGTD